jgi:hypothetical protein
MDKHVDEDSMRANIFEHSALDFWSKIKKVDTESIEVEMLQTKKGRFVCRLIGPGPSGTPVIAKRCRRDEAVRERTIYDKILPHLPLPTPQFYGYFEEADHKFAWLFLEEIGGENCSLVKQSHRILAARFLGTMHKSMVHLTDTTDVRDIGPDYFCQFFRPTKEAIKQSFTNSRLAVDDIKVLKAILSQCKKLEEHWDQIDEFCIQIPRTLVHGDFKEENMRVCKTSDEDNIVVFDWHLSGWGVPAIDYAMFSRYSVSPSVTTYLQMIQGRWPFMDIQNFRILGCIGEVFWCLASIRWEAMKLKYEWIEKPMGIMKFYKDWMAKLIKAEPLRAIVKF